MCCAMEYYRILDDIQLKLLFLTSNPELSHYSQEVQIRAFF